MGANIIVAHVNGRHPTKGLGQEVIYLMTCITGGWSTKSTVMEAKYVDFTIKPTKAALLFFGYLKKDCPT